MNNAIIATLTGRNENEVKSVSEWDFVYFVCFTSGRPTFVSKRRYFESASKIEVELKAGRRQNKVWLARITGKCPTYRFKRDFVEAASIDWGRNGMNSAVFEITAPGLYHDSDDDYSMVELVDGALEQRYCSKQEIQHILDKADVKAAPVSRPGHMDFDFAV